MLTRLREEHRGLKTSENEVKSANTSMDPGFVYGVNL